MMDDKATLQAKTSADGTASQQSDDKKWKWGKHPFAVKYTPKVFASFSKGNSSDTESTSDENVAKLNGNPNHTKPQQKKLSDLSSRWLKDQMNSLLTKTKVEQSTDSKQSQTNPSNKSHTFDPPIHDTNIGHQLSEQQSFTSLDSLTTVTSDSSESRPIDYHLTSLSGNVEHAVYGVETNSDYDKQSEVSSTLSSSEDVTKSCESVILAGSPVEKKRSPFTSDVNLDNRDSSFSTIDSNTLQEPLLHSSSVEPEKAAPPSPVFTNQPVTAIIDTPPLKTKMKNLFSSHKQSIATDLSHLPTNPVIMQQKTTISSSPEKRLKLKSPLVSKRVSLAAPKLMFSELLKNQNESGDAKTNENKVIGDKQLQEEKLDGTEGNASGDSLTDFDEYDDHCRASSRRRYSSTANKDIPFTLWSMSLISYFVIMVPLPAHVYGAITSAILCYMACCLAAWLLCPSVKSYEQYKRDLKLYFKKLEAEENQAVLKSKSAAALQKPKDMKGWIHYTEEYDPHAFSMSATQDVYSSLKNKTMCIFFGNRQLPSVKQIKKPKKRRRALRKRDKLLPQNDIGGEHQLTFVKVFILDIPKCAVTLEPSDLAMKRIWNRKFPMLLSIPPGAMITCHVEVTLEEVNNHHVKFADCDEKDGEVNSELVSFFILPNTGREKEDWFYQIQLCIDPLLHQITAEDYEAGRLPQTPDASYAHYMVERVAESQKILQRVSHGKKIEPHLAWLNALLGRAFWDVWHDPLWNTKIKNKIQRRLSKLNTPPFIKEINITELHLGHSLPIIHKGSLPVLDENGVWADLQVTYKGDFTLTLETQLNVDYYVQLISKLAAAQQTTSATNLDGSDSFGFSKLKAEETLQDEALSSAMGHSPYTSDEDQDENLATAHDLPEEFFEAIHEVHLDEMTSTFSESPPPPVSLDADSPEGSIGAQQECDPFLSDPRTRAFLESKTGKKVANVVGWLAKSKLAKRVAETDFAKKAYEKAYEKFRKMPIVLQVEVQSLKGTLAVNIPPPPTNRLWFGFRGNPVVFMTAMPRLGEKQVRLTYLTEWIEQKLKDELQKLCVLPSMQDITIRLMNSRLEELFPDHPYTY